MSDIQKIFGCSRTRAYEIVNSDGFPRIKIGKCLYVPEDEFSNWAKVYCYKEFKI